MIHGDWFNILKYNTWIFQVCKTCAFSPEKPTKRQTFYISGRSRYDLNIQKIHMIWYVTHYWAFMGCFSTIRVCLGWSNDGNFLRFLCQRTKEILTLGSLPCPQDPLYICLLLPSKWFQIFFIFTPIPRGNDPIWRLCFQMGWNHQLAYHQNELHMQIATCI